MRTAVKALINDGYKAFRLLVAGAIMCIVGLLLLVWTENSLPDSLRRELIALLALGLAGLGLFTVVTAHICLLIYRLRSDGRRR